MSKFNPKLNLLLIIIFLIGFDFNSPAYAQNDPGVALNYFNEQDVLPAAAFGQNFYWHWTSAGPFTIHISFAINQSEIFGMDEDELKEGEQKGTLSISVHPVKRGMRPNAFTAYFGALFLGKDSNLMPGLHSTGGEFYYMGTDTAGMPSDDWPSEYRGTPLRVVYKDGPLSVGKEILLAESLRSKKGAFSPTDPEDVVHEFAVSVTVKEAVSGK